MRGIVIMSIATVLGATALTFAAWGHEGTLVVIAAVATGICFSSVIATAVEQRSLIRWMAAELKEIRRMLVGGPTP